MKKVDKFKFFCSKTLYKLIFILYVIVSTNVFSIEKKDSIYINKFFLLPYFKEAFLYLLNNHYFFTVSVLSIIVILLLFLFRFIGVAKELEKENTILKQKQELEQNLQNTMNLFSNIFNTISGGVIILNKNGIPESFNPVADKFLKEFQNNWNKIPFYKLLEKLGCENIDMLQKILDGREKDKKYSFKLSKKLKDNEEFFLEGEVSTVIDNENISAIVVIRNFTKEKVALRKLKEREEQLRILINATPDIICFKDGKGRWIEANKADIELFSLNSIDYRGKTDKELAEFTHPVYKQAFLNCIYTDEKAWEKKGISRSDEIIIKPDGSVKVYDVIKVPLFNSDGSRKGLVVVGRDITEKKELEKLLNRTLRFSDLVLNIATQFIGVEVEDYDKYIDKSLELVGKFLKVSRAYVFRYDFERKIMINTHEWCDYNVEPQKSNLQAVPMDDFKDWVETHLNGDYIYIPSVSELTIGPLKEILLKQSIKSLITFPLMLDNECFGFVGFDSVDRERRWVENEIDILKILSRIYSNLERVRRMEEEKRILHSQLLHLQKMEAIGEMAVGIAHDFNNYLQIVINSAELLLMNLPEESKFKSYVEEIYNASLEAGKLTKKLLGFSRKETIKKDYIDLNKMVKDLMKIIKRIIGKDIDISFSPFKEEAIVLGDRGQLEQVIINLCLNAKDAIEGKGEIKIEISRINATDSLKKTHLWAETGKDYFVLKVEDNGRGIPEGIIDRIFEPFFTTKESGKGTGMGLAICYSIIEKHNGMITVESKYGEGSVFKIFLPEYKKDAEKKGFDERRETKEQKFSGLIVVFQDDTSIRSITGIMLSDLGFSVIELGNEDELFKILERNKAIRLLVFDLVLLKDKGKRLVERVKKAFPHFPILFLSGYSFEHNRKFNPFIDKKNFLQKPFNIDRLKDKVEELLKE